MSIHKRGATLPPDAVSFPANPSTTLSFVAFADEQTTVDVDYTITAPTGVSFAAGDDSLSGASVDLDDTTVSHSVSFTGDPQVPIHIRGQAKGASGGSFPLTWVVPVDVSNATLETVAALKAPWSLRQRNHFSQVEALLARTCELLESLIACCEQTSVENTARHDAPRGRNQGKGAKAASKKAKKLAAKVGRRSKRALSER